MSDILKYAVTEIKRHFQTPTHYVNLFGKRRDISRVTTALKIAVETVSTASTVSFMLNLLR